jgi:hypothetical protein
MLNKTSMKETIALAICQEEDFPAVTWFDFDPKK